MLILEESAAAGRYVVAGSDIKAGTLLHMSTPFVSAMPQRSAEQHCRCCLVRLRSAEDSGSDTDDDERRAEREGATPSEFTASKDEFVHICEGCGVVRYCSHRCMDTYHAHYHALPLPNPSLGASSVSALLPIDDGAKEGIVSAVATRPCGEECSVSALIARLPPKIIRGLSDDRRGALALLMSALRRAEVEARYAEDDRRRAAIGEWLRLNTNKSSSSSAAEGDEGSSAHADSVSAEEVVPLEGGEAMAGGGGDSEKTTPLHRSPCLSAASATGRLKDPMRQQAALWLREPHPIGRSAAAKGCVSVDAPSDVLPKPNDEALIAAALDGMDFFGGGGDPLGGGVPSVNKPSAAEEAAIAGAEEAGRIGAIQDALGTAEVADPRYSTDPATAAIGPTRLRAAIAAVTKFGGGSALLQGVMRDGSRGGGCGSGRAPTVPSTAGMSSYGVTAQDEAALRAAVSPCWADAALLVSNCSVMAKDTRDLTATLFEVYEKARRTASSLPLSPQMASHVAAGAAAARELRKLVPAGAEGILLPPTLVATLHPYFLPEVSADVFSSLRNALCCNSFGAYRAGGAGREPIATAVLVFASYFNHSCDPNVVRVMTGTAEARFYAARDIKKGEWVCISYAEPDKPLAERRASLLKNYRFLCRCSRCEGGDEGECAWRLCNRCIGRGYLRPLLPEGDDAAGPPTHTECTLCRFIAPI